MPQERDRHCRGEIDLKKHSKWPDSCWQQLVISEIKTQSHHRWSVHVHRLLMVGCRGVPVSKIVHVAARMHRGRFIDHGYIPKLGHSRGARWQWRRCVQMLSLGSRRAVFHDFLVFGALVLKPYFHLSRRKKRENNKMSIKNEIYWNFTWQLTKN